MTDEDIMPFGKHEGKKLANVPASYLLWLLEQGCNHGGVRRYIEENKTVLETEVKRQGNGTK